MKYFKQFKRLLTQNPFDCLLKKSNGRTILLTWNRGLGDIPLGIYALVYRIREFIPNAEITFLTRLDLAEGFEMLNEGKVIVDPSWKRGVPFTLSEELKEQYDLVIENADPSQWVRWQLGKLVPKLYWKKEWDALAEKYHLQGKYLGVHVHSETTYAYEKNWNSEHWKELFEKSKNTPILLFGFSQTPIYPFDNIIDLRGKTTLFEMLSIIKNHCSRLVVPDSGVLSIAYYINEAFPIKIVSLWADPKQGVLKQNVPSPNPELKHIPLIGKNKNIHSIKVEEVYAALNEV